MKKVFLLLGVLGLITSCSLDDDAEQYSFEAVGVDNATLPDTLIYGQRYQFPISYTPPTSCYQFYGFDFQRQDSTRYVTVINRVVENDTCQENTTQVEQDLDFEVLYRYKYVFKFYQGNDTNDEPIYLTKTIPVKDE